MTSRTACEPDDLCRDMNEFERNLSPSSSGQDTPPSERRTLTILFADVVGSTRMAEQLDPEDWAELMDQAFDLLTLPIARYEGTVARLMGDAVLAFFGAPTAHEDDPLRAALAALDIMADIQPFRKQVRQRFELDFNVRIGIHTGPAVVGRIGSRHAAEYTAMGDAPNLAARLQQAAPPGTVLISDATHRRVAPFLRVEALEPLELKGKGQPVQTYRVLGRKEQPDPSQGLDAPRSQLAGRQAELEILKELLDGVRLGRGAITCLIGEAGIGKSRLLQEVRRHWPDAESPWTWQQSRGVSYHATRPYSLFLEFIRAQMGVDPSDSPTLIREKIAAAVVDWPTEQGQLVTRAIELLLSVRQDAEVEDPNAEALKRQLLEALVATYRQAASRTPTVLVFDDLHWADPASVEVILHLFQLTETRPLLILCAMRPHRRSAGWQVKTEGERDYPHRYKEISLEPLAAEDGAALVRELLPIDTAQADLHQLILQKAEGNPFFLEEVVRALLEDGVIQQDAASDRWEAKAPLADIHLPDSLQALLTARIDRLEPKVRRTLQLASVIGRTFPQPVLAHINDPVAPLMDHLNTLQRAELIREAVRVPELRYAFLHELTRDATYATILRRDRRSYHWQVGAAIEQLYPEQREENAHRLAQHFQEAGDYARALAYFTLAGDAAARLFANTEAIEQYDRALALADRAEAGEKQLIYLYARRGRLLELSNRYDEALATYQDLADLAASRGSTAMELAALLPQATIHSTPTVKVDLQRGADLARRALGLAQELEDPRSQARAHWNLLLLENTRGIEAAQAVAHGKRALALAREHRLEEELAFTLHDLTRAYLEAGQLEEAFDAAREAQQLWRSRDNLPLLADNLVMTAAAYYGVGDLEQARNLAEEGRQVSGQIGSAWGHGYSLATLGPIYLEMGRFSDAIRAFEGSFPLAKQANYDASMLGYVLGVLGWLYVLVGEHDRSRERIEMGMVEHGRGLDQIILGTERVSPFALAALVNLFNEQGRLEEAAELAADLVASSHSFLKFPHPNAAIILILIGDFLVEDGQFDTVFRLLEAVLEVSRRQKSRILLSNLLLLQGKALLTSGREGEGQAALKAALAEARALGSRLGQLLTLSEWVRYEASRGEEAQARLLRQEARPVVQFIAEHIEDPGQRASFLATERVRVLWQNPGQGEHAEVAGS